MNKKMFIPVCLAFLSLGLTACDNTTTTSGESNSVLPSHTHTWAENWTHDGTNHWHACTDTSCTEVNGKVAHSGGTATCQEKAVCEVCEAEYGELAGHVYSQTWTCTAEGHYKTCTTEGCDQKTETTAHSGGEATCKAKGTCSECGEAYGEFGQHSWESVADSDFLASKATCTTQATYYKSCAICGETSSETFGSGDLLAHTGGSASCIAKAVCSECKQPYGEFGAHKGGTADCQNKAVCEVCKQPYGEVAASHVWDETTFVKAGADGHYHPCSVTGCEVHSEIEAHNPGAEATEDTPQTCTKCEFVITPATGHISANPATQWSGNDTKHWKDCQGCDEAAHITEEGDHVEGTPASCHSKAVCSVCEREYGATLPHTWNVAGATVETQPTSTTVGKVKVPCTNTECDSKHEIVLPVYNETNYETTLVENSNRISYEIALTSEAITSIVAADEVLDDAALTAVLEDYKQTSSVPSSSGYTLLVNGEVLDPAALTVTFPVDNKANIEVALRKSQVVKFYYQGTLINFAESNYSPIFVGTQYTVPNSGTYIFYLSKDNSIYGNCKTPVTYTSYNFKVNDVVYEADEITTPTTGYVAEYNVTLATEDVLTVYGTFAEGSDLIGTYTCETGGNYSVYISASGSITVVEATSELASVTLHYYNSLGWAEVACHAWTDAGANFTGGSWPGTTELTKDGDWYSITIEAISLEGLKVIFNNNDNGSQTGDITVDLTKTYYFGNSTVGYATVEETLAAYEEASKKVESAYSIAGSMQGWAPGATPLYNTSDSNIVETELVLAAGTYEFKIAKDSSWNVSYGNNGTFTDTTDPNWWTMSTSAGNCKIIATGGTYLFQFDIKNFSIFVTKVA